MGRCGCMPYLTEFPFEKEKVVSEFLFLFFLTTNPAIRITYTLYIYKQENPILT